MYILMNEDLIKKISSITDINEFNTKFQEVCEDSNIDKEGNVYVPCITKDGLDISIPIYTNDIHHIEKERSPAHSYKWNQYPETEPKENTKYLVSEYSSDQILGVFVHTKHDVWTTTSGFLTYLPKHFWYKAFYDEEN